MIVLICCSVLMLLFLGLFYYFKEDYNNDGWSFLGGIGTILCGTIIATLLFILPINRTETREFIIKLESYRSTITIARSTNYVNDLERVAFLDVVAALNAQLASIQYNNSRQWDYWIDDSIDSVKPIE